MTNPLPTDIPCSDVRIDAAGLSLAVRVWGDRSLPPVILQHGGKDHGRSWDWTVAALADLYCLIVPDLRGHGETSHVPGGGYSDADFVFDMAAVGDWAAERWEGPFALVGHSLGGAISLRYASAFPERVACIVSMEGLGYSQKSYDEAVATPYAERLRQATHKRLNLARSEARRFDDPEQGVARMASLHEQLSEAQSRHLALNALREDDRGWGWKHDPMMGFMDPRPTPPSEYLRLYAEIPCPVLLMYGLDSWATSPKTDGRLEAFQDARLIEYERAGHWLHHDRFDAFIADLRAFLGTHFSGPKSG